MTWSGFFTPLAFTVRKLPKRWGMPSHRMDEQ
jgi:hypothetical protein